MSSCASMQVEVEMGGKRGGLKGMLALEIDVVSRSDKGQYGLSFGEKLFKEKK